MTDNYEASARVEAIRAQVLAAESDVFDWAPAVRDGMQTAGLTYISPVGWAETDMVWKVNHMIVPKANALKCLD